MSPTRIEWIEVGTNFEACASVNSSAAVVGAVTISVSNVITQKMTQPNKNDRMHHQLQ